MRSAIYMEDFFSIKILYKNDTEKFAIKKSRIILLCGGKFFYGHFYIIFLFRENFRQQKITEMSYAIKFIFSYLFFVFQLLQALSV